MKFLISLTLFLLLAAQVFANSNAIERRTVAVVLLEKDDDDRQTVTTVFTTLAAAEKIANQLDVELTASSEAVEDNLFVFAINSADEKSLVVRILDEEGSEVAASNLKVFAGFNGKVLNVDTLEDGTYTFKIIGQDNKELSREVIIDRKNKK